MSSAEGSTGCCSGREGSATIPGRCCRVGQGALTPLGGGVVIKAQ